MEFFHDFENFQASSGAPQSQSQSSTEDPPKSQSEEEPSPESKEVRPSSQEQKGHAKSVKECTIPDVGSAGQGADDEHTIDHSTDEENEGEVSVRQILKISPEAFSLDTPFESDVEDVSGADLWPSLFDSVDWPPLSTSALFSDEEKYSSNIGDPSQFDIFFKDSSPEQILEFTGYSFTADATARDSGGASPSHVAEDSGESPKRARNTIAARKSRAKRRESIERPEMDSEAFLEQQPRIELGVSQERHEKAEEPENSTEAAMTKVSKTNASLGQKSPTFVPRASLVLDQQANPQESKYEVIRNALYTLSRNIYHWILDGVSRWLLQSFHCSQSTLINVRDFMRGCRRISWTCVSWNSQHGNGTSAGSLCFHES